MEQEQALPGAIPEHATHEPVIAGREARRRMGRWIVLGLPLTALLSAACIAWIDLPTASWIHAHGLDRHKWMLVLLSTPVALAPLAALYVLVYAIRRAWSDPGRREREFLVISIALLASMSVKDMLKRMFGRTWPRNVVDPGPESLSNCAPPSLGYVNDGLHSFQFFGGTSKPFQAFPSGSTALLLAIVLPLWVMFPRARAPLVLFTAVSLVCFVLTNTHFVGDIVAGLYVGGVAGLLAATAVGIPRR